jgi:RimJ/RimL family protein N-acetyltransferase
VWHWIETFREKVSDDFGPKDLKSFLEFMTGKWDRQKTWAVCGDGELAGLITFERLSPWLGIAHYLLKREFQGRGLGAKALRVAVAEIFRDEGVGKLEFWVMAGNLAMGSLLRSLGASREGTLVGRTLWEGKPKDMWLYGLGREAFNKGDNDVDIRHYHRVNG